MDELKRDVLRGFLRIGVFIGVTGLLLALVEPRDSAEFVLSVCSAAMGAVLVVAVAVMIRRERG